MKLAVIGRKQIGNSQMRKHREQSGTCCWMKAPSKHFFPKKWKCMHRENGLIHCVTLPCLPHAVSCCYQKGKKWKPFIRRRKSSYSCATHQKDMLQPVQLGKQWINHFLSFWVVGEEKEENKNFVASERVTLVEKNHGRTGAFLCPENVGFASTTAIINGFINRKKISQFRQKSGKWPSGLVKNSKKNEWKLTPFSCDVANEPINELISERLTAKRRAAPWFVRCVNTQFGCDDGHVVFRTDNHSYLVKYISSWQEDNTTDGPSPVQVRSRASERLRGFWLAPHNNLLGVTRFSEEAEEKGGP